LFRQVVDVLPGGPQPDPLEARQMQGLSPAVHIPLVCFGIAFPVMFPFVEGLYLRTGNPTFKALAKRWSKVALILFAIGSSRGRSCRSSSDFCGELHGLVRGGLWPRSRCKRAPSS
jgi:hypothetical protein